MIQFKVPAETDKSLHIQHDKLHDFYPYFHQHEEFQFMLILKGEGTLYLADSFHSFGVNDIFLIGSNQPHVFRRSPWNSIEKEEIETISIFFSLTARLSGFFSLYELKNIKDFILQNKQGFKVPAAYTSGIKKRILLLKQAEMLDQLVQFCLLLKDLSLISRELQPLSQTALTNTTGESHRINDICRYIKDNFRKDIDLEEVAKHACLTPPAFCRYFKKHTGLTFINYLNRMKIQEACKLITSQQHENMAMVAYDSGFNSVTSFNRVFRNITGFSPKEFFDHYKNRI